MVVHSIPALEVVLVSITIYLQIFFIEDCPKLRACIHRRTGQHPLGGQTEFCPNGERKLFVTRPRQGEKK